MADCLSANLPRTNEVNSSCSVISGKTIIVFWMTLRCRFGTPIPTILSLKSFLVYSLLIAQRRYSGVTNSFGRRTARLTYTSKTSSVSFSAAMPIVPFFARRISLLVNIVDGQMTVCELVDRYLKTKTGVRQSTKQGYVTVQRLLAKEAFGKKTIRSVKTSDAKLFLIKLQQEDGKSYSSIHTIRGVLRPAFQMAVDDDILVKNPFGFQLAGVLVNDAVTREAVTKEQMRKFLKFVHDDVVYCKYYEVVYILFHTGMRISEFCGLTLKDIDLENRTVNIDHQLQRTSDMRYIIETTKTDAGTRVLSITEDLAQNRCFRQSSRIEIH